MGFQGFTLHGYNFKRSMSEPGQSLLSHDGLKSCDVRCWSDSCQKIAGPRMQRSVFAAAKQPRHSIKSSTQTDIGHSRNGIYEYWLATDFTPA